jgi:hypothetical protein
MKAGTSGWLLVVLGATALVLAVLALATGSLTPLSLLVVDSSSSGRSRRFRHALHVPHKPRTA